MPIIGVIGPDATKPLAFVQGSGMSAKVNSGVAGTVFAGNTTVSNCVLLMVYVVNNLETVTAITSSMGTPVQVGSSISAGGGGSIWWYVIMNATGASRTITVTTSAGQWVALGFEFSGGATTAALTTTSSATSNTPSKTVTPPSSRSIVVVQTSAGTVSYSAFPTSPWHDLFSGTWSAVGGIDAAYQICSSTSNVTASWTATTGSVSWTTNAVTLN